MLYNYLLITMETRYEEEEEFEEKKYLPGKSYKSNIR